MAQPWESDPIVSAARQPWEDDPIAGKQARPGAGVFDAMQAGYQSSGTGLLLRGKLPDVTLDAHHAKWYENLAKSATQMAVEAPQMVAGAVAGAAAGAAAGPIGGILGGGAGAFAVPTAIRESLTQAYEANAVDSSADWLSRAGIVLKQTAKDALVGAATFGAGAAVGRAVGGAIAPAITNSMAVGTATRAISGAATTAELGTMVVTPSLLEGKLPEPEDFMNAAILLVGAKGAVKAASKLRTVYARTGVEPAQVVADAAKDPEVKLDLKPVEAPSGGDVVTVYHGSPHAFDKFDMSKIGTGEGAQSFGHGLYFAESQRTAEYYRDALADMAINVGGKKVRVEDLTPGTPEHGAFADIKSALYGKLPPEQAIKDIRDYIAFNKTAPGIENDPHWKSVFADLDARIEILKDWTAQGVAIEKGSLYKVEIPKTVVDKMLDWDKPLSEQTPEVQAAIKKAGYWPDQSGPTNFLGGRFTPENMRGEHVARPEDSALMEDRAAQLQNAGITGIKYFDGKSRDAGDGTRNYVLFDAEHARVVERDGQAVPTAYAQAARAANAQDAVPGEKAAEVAKSPFAEITQAKGEPARPTEVNYNYINTPDNVKEAAARLSQVYEADIQTQRRGTVSWEQTAEEAGRHLESILGQRRAPGDAASPAELLARKQMTVGALEDMMVARDRLLELGSRASPEDTLGFLASIERAAMVQSEFLGARAEAGRALNILKSTKIDAERVKQIQDVISSYKGDPQTLARMLKEIDTPEGAAKFARQAVKATTWQKVVEAWKAGLVSGPVTHAANVMGNTVMAAIRVPVDTLAATIGLVRSGPDKVRMSEPVARITGLIEGTLAGLKAAGGVLRTGDIGAKSEQHVKAIEGTKGEIIRLPFRALSAEDALFRKMNEHGESATLAVREAINEGHNPLTREFRERVAFLTENPTPEMAKAIEDAGERFTFNQALGDKGRAVQSFVKAWHLEWAVPFVRTPGNVLKELVRMTPFSPLVKEWRQDLEKGGAAADKALAEVIIGSSLAATVMSLSFSDHVSGAGDPDPAKRRVKAAAGWQPYSVRVGDKWYSYQRLQPVGTLIGLAADVAEVWEHMGPDERDKAPKMLAVAFANAVTNQTFLQGLTNIVNAMSDPDRFGPRFIQGLAASTVPAISGQTAQMMDPYTREINSVVDAVKNRIPGVRESLLASRDPFGEPILSRERLGEISPITVIQESKDKVRSEAARLGLAAAKAPKTLTLPAAHDRKLGEVELSPEQRDVFADVAGHFAYDALKPIVQSRMWDELPDMVKKRSYEIAFEKAHKVGRFAALPAEARAIESQRISEEIARRMFVR